MRADRFARQKGRGIVLEQRTVGMIARGGSSPQARAQAQRALGSAAGAEQVRHERWSRSIAGESVRVAIARTLALEPAC